MGLEEKIKRYQEILKRNNTQYTVVQDCLAQYADLDNRDRIFLLVFVPVLLEYTEWILAQAIADKKQRIYFLARDAYFFHYAAETISRARNYDLDCRYLKVSRYAIRQAQYGMMGEKCLDLLCTNGIDTTFEKVMKRAGLTEEESRMTAVETGHWESCKDVLNYHQLQSLKEELKKDSHFLHRIEAHSQKAVPAVIGYLRQEGLLEPVPYVFVDSGWIGTLQQSIEQLIRSEDKVVPPLQGYYFGMYEIPSGMNRQQYKTFYFDPETHLKRKVRFANSLFETIFSSPDGMTTGYQKTEYGYESLESDKKNPNAAFLNRCRELIRRILALYIQRAPGETLTDIKVCEELLCTFMSHPEPEEVELYGSLLFCDDVLEMQLQKAAAELSEDEIKRQSLFRKAMILAGLRSEVIHESAWIEGSIVRNGRHVSRYLRQAAAYKSFVYLKKMIKKA